MPIYFFGSFASLLSSVLQDAVLPGQSSLPSMLLQEAVPLSWIA